MQELSKKILYEGTQTEKNLWEAFEGKSMVWNKYTYFACGVPEVSGKKDGASGFVCGSWSDGVRIVGRHLQP